MKIDPRIKQIEAAIESNRDLYPIMPDFKNMDDATLENYLNRMIATIRDKYDLDGKGLTKYLKAIEKYAHLCETDEDKAEKFMSNYERKLIIKKLEKQSGLKWC